VPGDPERYSMEGLEQAIAKVGGMAQDDAREKEMRTSFNLKKSGGRHDVDAYLDLKGPLIPAALEGQRVEFELKSVTARTPAIGTSRDVGLAHLQKWRKLHWLFGIYGQDDTGEMVLQYCLYGSPQKMAAWFDEKTAYIAADIRLAEYVPDLLTDETLTAVVGQQEQFTLAQAKALMKNQYSALEYSAAADLDDEMLSRVAMLSILRSRARYVILRGATLNNPKIPKSYFEGWEKITEDHASRLRELVVESLQTT